MEAFHNEETKEYRPRAKTNKETGKKNHFKIQKPSIFSVRKS